VNNNGWGSGISGSGIWGPENDKGNVATPAKAWSKA
jgi:hypothetical protein